MKVKNIIWLLMVMVITGYGWTQEQISKKCPRCGHVEKQQDAKYCAYCGAKLQIVKTMPVLICPDCKRILKEKGARYCPFCGKKAIVLNQEIPEVPYEPVPEINPTPEPESVRHQQNKSADLLAKVLPPGCSILEKHIIDEGLRLTSQQRQIEQVLYSCAYSYKQIEDFYRRHPLKPPIMKFGDPILQTPMLILKFNGNHQKLELAIYTPGKSNNDEKTKKEIKSQMQRELQVSRRYQNEIAALEKLIIAGKVTRHQVQLRLDDLERRRQMSMNSRTYWQLKARERVCQLQQNILLLTVITQKKL